MPTKAENKILARIKKHKEEYDSKIGPSGEVRLSENFRDMPIPNKLNPDFPAEKSDITV